jgi:hypothetical protein
VTGYETLRSRQQSRNAAGQRSRCGLLLGFFERLLIARRETASVWKAGDLLSTIAADIVKIGEG